MINQLFTRSFFYERDDGTLALSFVCMARRGFVFVVFVVVDTQDASTKLSKRTIESRTMIFDDTETGNVN
jgi:hypothetical protein